MTLKEMTEKSMIDNVYLEPKKLKKTKNGKPVKNNQFSAWVTPARFEPATVTFVV